ncbi:MAG: PorT family protein [Winogradskyella sp.]|uniref:outer membrane beta-barrel protein n=1 Tax=Winogradskyella sp. TaxID=1883156 RepID=UPI0025E3B771|nr:outer membrane beta-barrel protein [Winogradskyella sp.]NRB59841.1 PorT family protein [Winogradskyella sp.]
MKNPSDFKYKKIENSETYVHSLNEILEFGVYNEFKFIRAKVKVDKSNFNTSKLSTNKEPEYIDTTVFLKVLIEGKAKLFSFTDSNSTKFFYSIDDIEIKPLIYKKYINKENKILENKRFRLELKNNLTHKEFVTQNFQDLEYRKKELIELFSKYNELFNSDYKIFTTKNEIIKINIRPGINYSTLKIQPNGQGNSSINFDSKFSLRIGLEAEFILPFNNNKWAIIVEPTLVSFKGENIESSSQLNINYRSLEIPVGLRYNFFLNSKDKLFLNTGFVFDLINNSTIQIDNFAEGDITSAQNFMFGLGFNNGKKTSFELRYYTGKNITKTGATAQSDLSSLSLILGYRIF